MQTDKETIRAWLKQKQTTLWGVSLCITAEDSLEQAVDWFQQQMVDFAAFEAKQPTPAWTPPRERSQWVPGEWSPLTTHELNRGWDVT